MNEISENALNEELNELFLVKIQVRENFNSLSTTRRSKIWSEETQNMHWLSHNGSLNLKDDNYWKPINGQIKLSVREYTCVVNWRWRTVFLKKAMQEVAEKLKKWKNTAIKRKILKTTKIGRISYAAWSGITNSESILLSSWLTEQLWQYLRSSSSSYYFEFKKPSREVGMLRNTREDMSILGSFFDRQHVRRDLLMNYTMIQEIWQHHRELEKRRKELRIVGAKNHCNQYFYFAFR